MPHRQVIQAGKLGAQFAAHSRQHARRVATSATDVAPLRQSAVDLVTGPADAENFHVDRDVTETEILPSFGFCRPSGTWDLGPSRPGADAPGYMLPPLRG